MTETYKTTYPKWEHIHERDAEIERMRQVVINLAKRHARCDRDDDWDYAIDCLGATLRAAETVEEKP